MTCVFAIAIGILLGIAIACFEFAAVNWWHDRRA